MKLYNSRTLKLEEFKPINEGIVNMYVCGPTVYDHAHIGNVRPIIVFDTLRRVIEANGLEVKMVSNFTDVDDKIIDRANKLGISEKEITEKYINAYNKIRKSLNTINLDSSPKVTENMDKIIDFIEDLESKGYAYEVDGDVYFRVSKINTYGEISHQNISDLKVGARIEENSKKESPLDFALWKKTDMGIRWDSKFSNGRPGWHTECVVMIHDNFDGIIDIHGGGMDLKFPHHENEVAQSEALYNNHLANFWVHNAMINIDGEKMSKSLGNVKVAKDIIDSLGANNCRWLINSVHYRKELNFSEETIEASKKELEKVTSALNKSYIKLSLNSFNNLNEYDNDLYESFLSQMNDDLNTANAYMVIFDSVKKLNQELRNKDIDLNLTAKITRSIEMMLEIIGIKLSRITLDESDKELYKNWNKAKMNKDYEQADKYRNELLKRGKL